MLNFNTTPYYDDFNEDKNFHRILFKPGVAVQARELTQAQTILQDQIGKFGKFVLTDGSNVSGGKYTFNKNVKSLKLQNSSTVADNIQYFDELYVVGESSKCLAKISSVDVVNYYINVKSLKNPGLNFESTENLNMFTDLNIALSYSLGNTEIQPDFTEKLAADSIQTISGCSGIINSSTFTIPNSNLKVGDVINAGTDKTNYVITEIGINGKYVVNIQLKQTFNNISATVSSYASNFVLEVNFSDGVYFTNNVFVKALPQSIIPNASTQYPSCCIGFEVTESIVDYIDDESLLDPSQGSYNYTAPGADRYKISLDLVSKPLQYGGVQQKTLTSSKFIELLRIKDGNVVFDNTNPTLGGLQDILAAQMYDHAGNFIVTPFNISFNESIFDDKTTTINTEISGGKAYLLGYPCNLTFPTHLTINKARETANSFDNFTNMYYGNSIRIKDVSGGLPLLSTAGAKVELHSAAAGSTSESTRLGFAYVGNIDYTTTNEYSLYLHNVSISEQKLKLANSVFAPSFSANIILTSGINAVTDASYNKLLFNLPYTNPASIFNGVLPLDTFVSKTVTSNQTTISSGSINIQFASGVATSLPLNLKNENFIIVAKSTNGSYVTGEYFDLNDVDIKVEKLLNDEYRATLTFTGYNGAVDIKYSIIHTNPTPKIKTLITNASSKVTCLTTPTSIGYSDVVRVNAIYKLPVSDCKLIGDWNNSSSYAKNNVVIFANKAYISNIDSNQGNNPLNSASWDVVVDTKQNYKIDSGQKEFLYDHGTIAAKSKDIAGDVIVLFDYYQHGEGQYISFESYTSGYGNIPSIRLSNTVYNLKDYVDFRPIRKSGQDSSDKILFDSNSYYIPSSITDSRFHYDMSYYLSRIDKLILSKDKTLTWETGKSSYRNPVAPKDQPNGMTIATIQFNPYTPDNASIKISYAKHRRYTMDDIGTLDTRLSNVEYYTALTLGEKTVLNTNITDEYGTRLKNGFIVDSFTDFSVMDLSKNNKEFSVDFSKNEARPPFLSEQHIFELTPSSAFGQDNILLEYNSKEELVSFLSPFQQPPEGFVIQNNPTTWVKINQFDAICYNGVLKLNPSSSLWNEQDGEEIVYQDQLAELKDMPANPTAAIFGNWVNLHTSHPEYTLSTDTKEYTVTNADGSQTVYKAGIATSTPVHSTIKESLKQHVNPKAKEVDINFSATGLAPLTRMYIYVNGLPMNGYVTPRSNPIGIITGIEQEGQGDNYSSNTTITLSNSTRTIAATFEPIITNKKIDYVVITNQGSGYSTENEKYELTITSSTTPTSNAKIYALTLPKLSTALYTDKFGECSGTLKLPNDEQLSFIAGEIMITICDSPHLDFKHTTSKAVATFYAKHTYYTEVKTSIREPYAIIAKQIPPPRAPSAEYIIKVPPKLDYIKTDYLKNYTTDIKTGTITIPVYLSGKPTKDVTVTYNINASNDKSANTTITSTFPASFTFTPTNFSTTQNLTLSYDLGDRQKDITNDKWKPNTLPTYIEFYAESEDVAYNYNGSKPASSWSKPTTGVQNTNLNGTVNDNPQLIAPFLSTKDITIENAGTDGLVPVQFGGGTAINEKGTNVFPLNFTAVSDDESTIKIFSSGIFGSLIAKEGNVRTIKESESRDSFNFNVISYKQGIANVTITTSSANEAWANKTAVSKITVGEKLQLPPVDIIVLPFTDVVGSNTTRRTNSTGSTTTIAIKLSRQPANTVSVKANSSLIVGGGQINGVMYPNNVILVGNTATFTANTWDQPHIYIVKGNNAINDIDVDTPYNIDLKSESADSDFNGIVKQVPIINTDYNDLAKDIIVVTHGKQTTGNGSIDTLEVSLKKNPLDNNVKVTFTSSDTLKGGIIISPTNYGVGTVVFDSTNWDKPQQIVVKGAKLENSSFGDISRKYNINYISHEVDKLTGDTKKPDTWYHNESIPFVNLQYKVETYTQWIVNRDRTYSVKIKDLALPWKPQATITNNGTHFTSNKSGAFTNRTHATGADGFQTFPTPTFKVTANSASSMTFNLKQAVDAGSYQAAYDVQESYTVNSDDTAWRTVTKYKTVYNSGELAAYFKVSTSDFPGSVIACTTSEQITNVSRWQYSDSSQKTIELKISQDYTGSTTVDKTFTIPIKFDPFEREFIVTETQTISGRLIRYRADTLKLLNDETFTNDNIETPVPIDYNPTCMLAVVNYLIKNFGDTLSDTKNAIGEQFWKKYYKEKSNNYRLSSSLLDSYNKDTIEANLKSAKGLLTKIDDKIKNDPTMLTTKIADQRADLEKQINALTLKLQNYNKLA